MSLTEQALVQEFVRLRHGWGLPAAHLRNRVGPHLIDLCGIVPEDNDRTIRNKITTTVKHLTHDFAPEDQLAVEIALGITPGAQHRLLSARVDILARQLNCAERTARRNIDRAFAQLAQEAAAQRAAFAVDGAADDPEKGWYVRRFEALLRLDTPTPEVTETRTVVAMRSNLKKIGIRFSLPARQDGAEPPRELHVDIAYGARIESVERQGEAHFRILLDLPRALARDEAHTYSIIFRIPAGQPMRPRYAMVPLVQVDSFQVRVRFHPDRRPVWVWRFDELAPRTLDDREMPGRPLELDDANEVVQEFERMKQGFGYGIAWGLPSEPPGGPAGSVRT